MTHKLTRPSEWMDDNHCRKHHASAIIPPGRDRSQATRSIRCCYFFGGGGVLTGAGLAPFFGFFFSLPCELLPFAISRPRKRCRNATSDSLGRENKNPARHYPCGASAHWALQDLNL